jgi:hypothetical protein
MPPRIAILWHARQPPDKVREYSIGHLADHWRDDGLDVIDVFGTGRFVPADIALVHVDVSVVPERYLRFAQQYPVVLNGALRDIRKGVYSELQLTKDSAYRGRVIVKTQRNHGGKPEKKLAPFDWLRNEATPLHRRRHRRKVREPLPYKIYADLHEVPRRYFRDRRWIVERFLPDYDDGMFYAYNLNVLGSAYTCVRRGNTDPLVCGAETSSEEAEPHPRAVDMVERLGIDYGKVDYVVHDGRAYILDVNKTTGALLHPDGAAYAARRARALGIYDYLDGSMPHLPRRGPQIAPSPAWAKLGRTPSST